MKVITAEPLFKIFTFEKLKNSLPPVKMLRKGTVYTLLIVALCSLFVGAAPGGYKIIIRINQLSDTVCFLASYFGDKTFLIDTAFCNSSGECVFQGDTTLDAGMYLIAGQKKNKLFDFIITDRQNFRIETDAADFTKQMKFKGSEENTLFYEYINFLSKKYKEVDYWQNLLKRPSQGEDSVVIIRSEILKVDREVKDYRNNVIYRHSGTFLATFLTASIEPEIPPDPGSMSGNTDSSFAYRYYKQHYWDNFDLNDERLLRTPLFQKKIDDYFAKLVIPVADSLCQEIDRLLLNVAGNNEIFKYLLWNFIVKYERSEIMGMDAVFVHLVKKYIRPQRLDWLNETVRQNLIDRAKILDPLLIGKPAPVMILLDTNDIPVSLYSINAQYTIIYFWEKDCGHCQKETPLLKAFYNNSHDSLNFEVYAVCIDTSIVAWKKYIHEKDLRWINVNGYLSMTSNFHDLYDVHSSPVMYLLDQKKNILAKRILTEQIKELILKKEKMKNEMYKIKLIKMYNYFITNVL